MRGTMKTYAITFVVLLAGFTAISCSPGNTSSTQPPDQTTTDVATVANSPKTETQSFDINSTNAVLPSDILQEVIYYGSGGGLDCDGNYSEPTIFSDPRDSELMLRTQLITCAWESSQTLQGKITYPDGAVKNFPITADERGVAYLNFAPSLSEAEGVYTFEISNGVVTLQSNAYFHTPTVPRAYEVSDTQIFLHNFMPKEKVQLFAYDCIDKSDSACNTYSFIGWEEYKAGDDGDLLINIPNKEIYYSIMSSTGIEIPFESEKRIQGFIESKPANEKYKNYFEESRAYLRCNANTSTKIKLVSYENWGMVETPDGSDLPIYSNPRTSARVIDNYSFNQEFLIIEGPFCFKNGIWWSVRQDWNSDSNGYAVEFDGNYYFKQIQK
jgi:hypothetical protein